MIERGLNNDTKLKNKINLFAYKFLALDGKKIDKDDL